MRACRRRHGDRSCSGGTAVRTAPTALRQYVGGCGCAVVATLGAADGSVQAGRRTPAGTAISLGMSCIGLGGLIRAEGMVALRLMIGPERSVRTYCSASAVRAGCERRDPQDFDPRTGEASGETGAAIPHQETGRCPLARPGPAGGSWLLGSPIVRWGARSRRAGARGGSRPRCGTGSVNAAQRDGCQ